VGTKKIKQKKLPFNEKNIFIKKRGGCVEQNNKNNFKKKGNAGGNKE
jgi:hypothetical protein